MRLRKQKKSIYDTIFRESSVIMLIIDPESGNIIEANRSALNFYGYTESEIKEISISDINILTEEEIQKEMNRARERTVDYFEFRHRLKNGGIKDVAVQSSPVSVNGQTLLFSTIRDISEKKKLENDLKLSEMRFRSYIEKSPLPILIVNRKGYINYANPAALEITSVNQKSLTGLKAGRFAADNNEKDKAAFYAETIDSNGEVLFEFCIKNNSGKLLYLIIKAVKLTEDEFILFCLDITERKNAEVLLVEEKKKAEEASRAKSDFLSNMSHELKTPLNGIIGFAELIYSIETDEDKKGMLSLILESGENLTSMINDILTFVKTEHDCTDENIEFFSLRQFVLNTGKTFALLAGKKGLSFFTDIASNVPEFVTGSKSTLRHITGNLLANAVKYTEEGTVTFSVLMEGKTEEDCTVIFKIADTGIGINRINLERIFEQFEREKNNLTDKYGGLGLGLSIVKNLAEKKGGFIDVRSEKGRGSVFTVGLRFHNPLNLSHFDNKQSSEKLKRKKLKILAAEDDRTNRYLLEKIITSKGWNVDLVEDGEDVLKAVAGSDYDVIVLDINLPVMDGLQTARKLREMGLTVPVIALTAYSSSNDCTKCLDAGMDCYLSKPISRKNFYNTIESIIENKNSL
ncbi:MAG TPA: PAS domain S-box protein [Spirochaetota bacterium]|nr:PAS domain S-box protein [Spirochaetota bacterium]HPJ33688.1 PAS domain S-box protein [Spirochaetota bacterium]